MALVKDFVNVIVNLETIGQTQFIPTIPEVDITAAIWQPGSASTHAAFLSGSFTLEGSISEINFIDNSNVTYSGSSNAAITKNVAIGGRTAFEISIVSSNAVSTDQNVVIEYKSDAANRVGFKFFPSMGMVRAFQVVGGVNTNVGDPIPYTLGTKTLIVFDSTQPTGVGIGIVIGNTIFTRPTDLIVDVDATLVQNLAFETLSGSQVTRVFLNDGDIPWDYVIPSGFYPMGEVLAAGGGMAAGDFVGKNFQNFTSTTLQFLIPEDATGAVLTLDAAGTSIDGHEGRYRKRKTTVTGDMLVEFWSLTAPTTTPIYAFMTYDSSGAVWSAWSTLLGSTGLSPWYPGGDGESNLFDVAPFVAPVTFPLEILGPSQIKIDSAGAAGQLSNFGTIDEPTITFQGNRYIELLPFDMNNIGTLQTALFVTSNTGETMGIFFTINGSNVVEAQFFKDGFSDNGVPTTALTVVPLTNGQTLGLAVELLPVSGNLRMTATTPTTTVVQDMGIAFIAGVDWTPVFKAITNSLSTSNVYDTSWTINSGYFPFIFEVPASFHPSGGRRRDWMPSPNPLIDVFAFATIVNPAFITFSENKTISYDSGGTFQTSRVELLSKCGGAFFFEWTPTTGDIIAGNTILFRFDTDLVPTVGSATTFLGFEYDFETQDFSIVTFNGLVVDTILDTISLPVGNTVSFSWDTDASRYLISNADSPLQQAAGVTTGIIEFDNRTVYTPGFIEINDDSLIVMDINLGQYPFTGTITESHTPIALFENGVRTMTQTEATAGSGTGPQSISAKILSDTIDNKIAAIPPPPGTDHVSADFFPTLGTYDGLTRDGENATFNSTFAGSGFRGTLSALKLADGAIWELTALTPDSAAATDKLSMTIFSGSGSGNYSISYNFSTSTFEVRNEAGVDLTGVTVGTLAAAIGEPVQFQFENRDGVGGGNPPQLSLLKGGVPSTIPVINLDLVSQQGIGIQGENNANGKIKFALTRSQLTQANSFANFPNNVQSLVEANFLSGNGGGGVSLVNQGPNSGLRLFDNAIENAILTSGTLTQDANKDLAFTLANGSTIRRTGTRFSSSYYFEFTPTAGITAGQTFIVMGRVNDDGTQGGNPNELCFEYDSGTRLMRIGTVTESATAFSFVNSFTSTGVASTADTYGISLELTFVDATNSNLTYTIKNLTSGDTESQVDVLSNLVHQEQAYSLILGATLPTAQTGTQTLNLGQFPLEGVVPEGLAPPAWVTSVPYEVDGADTSNRTSTSPGVISVQGVQDIFTGAGADSVRVGVNSGAVTQGPRAVAIGLNAGNSGQQDDSVAIGSGSGQTNQGTDSVAIGRNAAFSAQGAKAVSVGFNAGQIGQGTSAVAVGDAAGAASQGTSAIAIGEDAGNTGQGTTAIAIGKSSGQTNQSNNAVAIGNFAGTSSQGTDAIAIGRNTGNATQGANAIAIGVSAASVSQGTNAIALGNQAGLTSQGNGAVSVGNLAGNNVQGLNAVAIGDQAGNTGQADLSVAVGSNAGQISQGINAVALGAIAGKGNQGAAAVAIGVNAGETTQGANSVAIGVGAGKTTQSNAAVAIGQLAGETTQGLNGIAIGVIAGQINQGSKAIAIGAITGTTNQGANSVAIGNTAGNSGQGIGCVALGLSAGTLTQGASAVAIGDAAGSVTQGASAVAIGDGAGNTDQGANAIAIGAAAGSLNQEANGVHIKTTDFEFEYVPSTKILNVTNSTGDLVLHVNGIPV